MQSNCMYCRLSEDLVGQNFFSVPLYTHACFTYLLIACTQQEQLPPSAFPYTCDALPID